MNTYHSWTPCSFTRKKQNKTKNKQTNKQTNKQNKTKQTKWQLCIAECDANKQDWLKERLLLHGIETRWRWKKYLVIYLQMNLNFILE